jgi:hypothetical protein
MLPDDKKQERGLLMGYAHGIRWSDQLIKEKVLEVKAALNLDRMPSKSECDAHFGNYALSNVISKKKGWYNLAAELNLQIKKSDTLLGKQFEKKAKEILENKGFKVRQMSQNFPYDLLVDDCVKIDVKESRLYKGKTGEFYSFNLEKNFATCDVFLLVALNDNDSINRIMVVPSKAVFNNNQISVGKFISKYDKFIDKWEYISNLSAFWSGVVC